MKTYDVIVCGGGAAGFFSAICIVEANPNLSVAIIERGSQVLEKVRISGGGRCNVMHACYNPTELTTYYPRGEKELRGPFHHFSPRQTQQWFLNHGVPLKTEADGRMFPQSNSSKAVIDCFINAAKKLNIDVLTNNSVKDLSRKDKQWVVQTTHDQYLSNVLVLATGSNSKIWQLLGHLGHTIVPPVPSLFTFSIADSRISNLQGVSAIATVNIYGTKLSASGPLLITHWGLSGPGVLKLSAWGARLLAEKKYRFTISINWLPHLNANERGTYLQAFRQANARKNIVSAAPENIPNRLWINLLQAAGIAENVKWADISKNALGKLTAELCEGRYQVNGKNTFKEEFVTAGGVELSEVNFKTMESKLHNNMFFAGEILNIDAITGGFNFQNAWTNGFIAANSIAAR